MEEDRHGSGNASQRSLPAPDPRYEGEDTSPTSDRELQGWYCYGMAAEVFAVVGTGSFLPVTMEQLARESGVLYSDRSTPCTAVAKESASLMRRANSDKDQCIINVLGAEMTSSSFVMYTFSVAVFVQALTLISFSTFADYGMDSFTRLFECSLIAGNNRKRLLVLFAFTGAITVLSFIFVTPSILPLGSLLAVISITCLGCSFVMLNSFLPLLTSRHPSIRSLTKSANRSDPLSGKEVSSPAALLSNKISSKGVALGYSTSVLVQLLAIAILLLAPRFTASTTLPLRSILFLVGVWWAVFTIPTVLFLRSRPGPPLPASLLKSTAYATQRRPLFTFLAYLTFAWRSLYRTLRLALSLRQLRLYLLAWFLLSDAIATVGTTAILFARTTLGLPPEGVAFLSITATCSGIAGSLLWPVISRRYSLATNRTIVSCMILMEVVPIYGLLGYLPPIRALGFLGLQQAWEIFPLAIIYGVAQGGLSSYCRSFFGQLIPPGQEVAFYALFAITDKGSSAIGPAIVGRDTDATGSIRPAFIFLLFLIGLPIFIVRKVNEEKGKLEAEAASRKLSQDFEQDIELSEHPVESEGLMRGRQD